MQPSDLVEYREKLRCEIASWRKFIDTKQEPWWPLIQHLPQYLDALVSFKQDPTLSQEDKRIANRVLKYLVSPLDLMPEYIFGPRGYREDFYLIALAVGHWSGHIARDILLKHHLNPDDEKFKKAHAMAETDLDDNIKNHLALLLHTDAVAGDEQLEAVKLPETGKRKEKHTIVFAGPGTGKTYTLETELFRLMHRQLVKPEHLLVTTFTNKAADELRLRVRKRLGEEAKKNKTIRPDQIMQKLWIGTIHAFCYQLIAKFHHHLLFLKGTFAPITETGRLLFLFRHGYHDLGLQELYAEWKEWQQECGSYKSGLFQFYEDVGSVYDFLSEEVIGGAEDEALKNRYLKILYQGGRNIHEKIIRTYPAYWEMLQQDGFLDYAMALTYVEALLDDHHVLAHVQKQYQYLLVDEYQDTNPIQDRIFRKIAGKSGRMFAVADDDQSIYAFRGADFRNALEFTGRWPEAEIRILNENRRSSKYILAASQALIEKNQDHQPKKLLTRNSPGEKVWRLEAGLDELPGKLAELLAKIKREKYVKQWSDIALLTRCMNKRVKSYHEALQAQGIPVSIVGDKHFFKQPLINGLIGALTLVHGNAEAITTRKYRHKTFFTAVGIEDKNAMLDRLRQWNQALHEPDKKKPTYDSLVDLFYKIMGDVNALDYPDLLPELGRFSNILGEIEEQVRSRDLVKRLGYLLDFIKVTEGEIEGPAPDTDDAVQLMTIHKSKGLEFPVVVILDVLAGSIPAHFPPDPRLELRCVLGGENACLDITEEERRVLYVGMTRAESLLIMTTTKVNPSPFLKDFEKYTTVKQASPPAGVTFAYPKKRSQPVIHAPHSHIYNYHFCPKRYLLENRCQFATRAIQPLRAGLSLHRAVEILHRLLLNQERITAQRRELIFERAWIAPGSAKENEREYKKLFQVFERYAATWDNGHKKKVLELEHPFYVTEKQDVLTGKMDLVQESAGQLEIVEFKFHKNPLMPDYPLKQLENYSLAYAREKPALKVYYFQEELEENVSARPPEAIREDIAMTFENIRHKRFDPKPQSAKCRVCPVKSACAEKIT